MQELTINVKKCHSDTSILVHYGQSYLISRMNSENLKEVSFEGFLPETATILERYFKVFYIMT